MKMEAGGSSESFASNLHHITQRRISEDSPLHLQRSSLTDSLQNNAYETHPVRSPFPSWCCTLTRDRSIYKAKHVPQLGNWQASTVRYFVFMVPCIVNSIL